MDTNTTNTNAAPAGYALQLNDVLNTLDISGFTLTNSSLFTAMMTLNLLWSAIFLVSFYLLIDMAMYYIPYLHKVPLLSTIKNLTWFVTTLLVAVAIYASGTLLIIKIFGAVVLFLAFSGLVRTFYLAIAMALSYYRHRSWTVAFNGPNVVMVNGTAVHTDYIPTSVTLTKRDGELYYNGCKVPGNNLGDASVKIYTFNDHLVCEPISVARLSRGQYHKFELKSTNTHFEIQTYYPTSAAQKTV